MALRARARGQLLIRGARTSQASRTDQPGSAPSQGLAALLPGHRQQQALLLLLLLLLLSGGRGGRALEMASELVNAAHTTYSRIPQGRGQARSADTAATTPLPQRTDRARRRCSAVRTGWELRWVYVRLYARFREHHDIQYVPRYLDDVSAAGGPRQFMQFCKKRAATPRRAQRHIA